MGWRPATQGEGTMNVKNTTPCLLFVACFTVAAVAGAQTGAPAPASTPAEGEQLDFSRAALTDLPNDPGGAFVARAIVDRSWSVTLGSSSTLDGYTFPVNLQLMPFLWSPESLVNADNASGLMRLLLQSSVTVKYVPLVVKRPPGQKTGTDTSSDRKGSITYSLPLLGSVPAQKYTDVIRKAIEAATKAHPSNAAEFAKAATAAREKIKAEYTQFTLLGTAGFGWDTRQDKPNSFNAGLIGSKVLTPVSEVLNPSHDILTLNTSAVETWFQAVGTAPAFSRFSGGIGLDLLLPAGIMLSLAPNWDHYSDGGYAVILGFANTTRRDDVTLKETVTFKIPNGNKLALSVSEEHLGTSDHDVAINLGVNYKLPFPADIGTNQ
jgi:hypothetical protein